MSAVMCGGSVPITNVPNPEARNPSVAWSSNVTSTESGSVPATEI